MLAECLHNSSNRGCFLTDSHIDAVHGLSFLEILALVDDSVDGDSGLTNLAVADDKLALTTTYRHHRVDSLQTGLEGLLDGLTVNNAGRLALEGQADKVAANGAAAIDRLAQNVDDASEQPFAHGNGSDFAGSAYCHILGDFIDVVEEDDTDVALFEVHGYAFDAVFELHEFVGTNFVEAIDVRNVVSDFE